MKGKTDKIAKAAEEPKTASRPRAIAEYVRSVRRTEATPPSHTRFAPPRKLYRISEVARHFRLTRQTVHNYATIGLITETDRTPGGQRLFDESVFPRVHQIQEMKRRYRLHDIRRMLMAQDAGTSRNEESS